MGQESFVRLRDWVEPAHPSIVGRFTDLVAIYTRIRDQFQKQIDAAFDRVSRQIGFVVTTTIPMVIGIGENDGPQSINVGAEHLKGTLFEKELLAALKPQFKKADTWKVSPGNYNLYLIWYDALKLKLRTDWMEPAHFRRVGGAIQPEMARLSATQTQEALARIRWDVREPAHWFDPGIAISPEEAVLIEAIDQVYADLRLVERVSFYRQTVRRVVRPEVQEPAHFRRIEELLQSEKGLQLGKELAALLHRYGY
jgi:hypothetical protein